MKSLLRFIFNPKTLFRKISNRLYSFLSNYVLRDNDIRHYYPSVIYSKDNNFNSPWLIQMTANAINLASDTYLNCGKDNLPDSQFLNIFPGEHYRLLNSIVKVCGAKKIVEIGTFTGMGTLALVEGIDDVQLVTFDIIEWDNLGVPSHFKESDFNRNIRQIIGDLSKDDVFNECYDIINDADLIFMDAPKDDNFEYEMAKKLSSLKPKELRLLIIDDIHFVNMIDFWRNIQSPKLDISSFGHWSGTGIVDISSGFKSL